MKALSICLNCIITAEYSRSLPRRPLKSGLSLSIAKLKYNERYDDYEITIVQQLYSNNHKEMFKVNMERNIKLLLSAGK